MFRVFRNKKGEEDFFSIWWFLILGVVGAGIVVGVGLFYGGEVDIRGVQTSILNNKIYDCIVKQGILVEEILENSFDIYTVCQLDKDSFSEKSSFYFRVELFGETGNKLRPDLIGGKSDLETDCKITQGAEAEHYPRCFERSKEISYYKEGLKMGDMKIFTASNNYGNKIGFGVKDE